MSIGGLIKCNSTSNAYACCCQFLSRIKPIIMNSSKQIKLCDPDSKEFNLHAALIDIYYQIKDGSDDIDISPFVNICDFENKKVDLITLLNNILLHFDPKSKIDEIHPENIFYTLLFTNDLHKFRKKYVFDFKFINEDANLTDSIKERYEHISSPPKILLFTPTNQLKFNLSFILTMKNLNETIYFILFSFVITKHDDPSHNILYISKSSDFKSDWLCIDEDKITVVQSDSLKNLAFSEENDFIMFAFVENITRDIEFLCPTLTKIPVFELETISQDENQISPSSQIEKTEHHSPQRNITSPSSEISQSSQSLSTPKRHKKAEELSLDLSLHQNDKCRFYLKLFLPAKMKYKNLYEKECEYYFVKQKIDTFLKDSGILSAYYSKKSENHKKFHKHISYDREIYVYVQLPNEPQILKFFLCSKKVSFKFVCKEIKIFETKATFDKSQPTSDLYDFCHILLEDVLGIQVKEIQLTLKKNIDVPNSNNFQIDNLIWANNEGTILFSYKEK